MIDPGTAMIASTVIGGLFGRGGRTKSIGNKYYARAFQEALKLYHATDYDAIDKAALEEYQKGAETRGSKMLSSYDAYAAGGGSPIGKMDTNKDLSRAAIAGGVSSDVSRFASELMLSRPSRKRALLPGLDQPSNIGIQRQGSNIDSLMDIGTVFGDLLDQQQRGMVSRRARAIGGALSNMRWGP